MKCPKCHYLSFDPEPRCRNCGYTLTLDVDLDIHPEGSGAPLPDLELRPDPPTEGPAQSRVSSPPGGITSPPLTSPRRARTTPPGPFDEGTPVEYPAELLASQVPGEDSEPGVPAARVERSARPATEQRPSRGRPVPPATAELPLFVRRAAPDSDVENDKTAERAEAPPTVATAPAGPSRTGGVPDMLPLEATSPLGVRRTVRGDVPVARPQSSDGTRLGPLDRDLLEGLQRIEHVEQQQAAAEARRARLQNSAGAARRLAGAACDALLLGGLCAAIVWVTLRWCDLSWAQVPELPALPFGVFLLLVVVGYLVMFTMATGQTVGKMVAGTRVVDAGDSGAEEKPASARQVVYRELLTVPSVLALGAGLIPAVMGDERAMHDRLARTRVVRA